MKERVIYDPGEPVLIRSYASEALAALDQARLEAAEIPAFIQQSHYTEVHVGWVSLIVRREHAGEALTLLGSPPTE
ncbi:MAG TPA: hypothetical protein VFT29_10545 [Gemmatimonadaceae bacterium]|nr:hypothetical protein [Gemmatimonadaceae bacterium]